MVDRTLKVFGRRETSSELPVPDGMLSFPLAGPESEVGNKQVGRVPWCCTVEEEVPWRRTVEGCSTAGEEVS